MPFNQIAKFFKKKPTSKRTDHPESSEETAGEASVYVDPNIFDEERVTPDDVRETWKQVQDTFSKDEAVSKLVDDFLLLQEATLGGNDIPNESRSNYIDYLNEIDRGLNSLEGLASNSDTHQKFFTYLSQCVRFHVNEVISVNKGKNAHEWYKTDENNLAVKFPLASNQPSFKK